MTIYSENNVPVLFRGNGQRVGLSQKMWDTVDRAHQSAVEDLRKAAIEVDRWKGEPDGEEYAAAREAQAAAIDKHLLIGESVLIDNPDDAKGDYTYSSCGASDLQEALQEAIGGFDLAHIGDEGVSSDIDLTPKWVASTHKQLAEALADYYSCEVRDLNEVL